MGEIKNYRNLEVWQLSMNFTEDVYRLVRNFPKEERYGLSDQMRRAVVAIPSNIAEGNGRGSKKDYAHFLCIARGSLYEVNTQLEIAERLGFLTIPPEVAAQSVSIAKMLNALIRALGNGESGLGNGKRGMGNGTHTPHSPLPNPPVAENGVTKWQDVITGAKSDFTRLAEQRDPSHEATLSSILSTKLPEKYEHAIRKILFYHATRNR